MESIEIPFHPNAKDDELSRNNYSTWCGVNETIGKYVGTYLPSSLEITTPHGVESMGTAATKAVTAW